MIIPFEIKTVSEFRDTLLSGHTVIFSQYMDNTVVPIIIGYGIRTKDTNNNKCIAIALKSENTLKVIRSDVFDSFAFKGEIPENIEYATYIIDENINMSIYKIYDSLLKNKMYIFSIYSNPLVNI